MIYFLYTESEEKRNAKNAGAIRSAALKKARALAQDLLKKKPDASFFTLTDENWNENIINEYTSNQGLFEKKNIILASNIFSGETGKDVKKKERKELFLEKIEMFAESPNIFIFAEESADAAFLKKIEKHAEKVQAVRAASDNENSFSSPTPAYVPPQVKIFDLADALGARDKKRLWMLYRQAVEEGKASEEIHGILFWQVKSMIIASRAKTAAESGLNPFVYSKAKNYAANFSDESSSLKKLLENLISIYHDSHRGIRDFETALEIFILKEL